MDERVRKCQHGKKGFTLVEIIVVLVILAILAAILIPSMVTYIKKANEKKDLAEGRNIIQAAQTYTDEHLDEINKQSGPIQYKVLTSAAEGTAGKEIADLAEMPDDWTAHILINAKTKQVYLMQINTPENIILYGREAYGKFPKGWKVTPIN